MNKYVALSRKINEVDHGFMEFFAALENGVFLIRKRVLNENSS